VPTVFAEAGDSRGSHRGQPAYKKETRSRGTSELSSSAREFFVCYLPAQ